MKLGQHFFWINKEYRSDQVDNLDKYLTLGQLKVVLKRPMFLVKTANNKDLENQFEALYGYKAGFRNLLQKWNPGMNFRKLQVDDKVYFTPVGAKP